MHVESLPYLGTGKLDLRRLKEIAVEATGTTETRIGNLKLKAAGRFQPGVDALRLS